MLFAASARAGAATINVNTTADSATGMCPSPSSCTLRQAIAQAGNGDTIMVPDGTYALSSGALDVTTGVTIQGEGQASTIIQGDGAHGVMQIASNTPGVVLENLSIIGGKASTGNGGGIDATGAGLLSLNGVTVSDNSVNTASGGGAGIFSSSGLSLTDSTVTDNTATLTQSTGDSGGGGIMVTGGGLTVDDSTINGNNAAVTPGMGDTGSDGGGGVWEAGGTGQFVNSTVTGNTAGGGGGLLIGGGGTTIANATINGNTGGGISSSTGTTVNVADSIVAGNGTNCAAPVVSEGYNLTDDPADASTCGFAAATSDILGADPGLGGLGNNGGPTETEALTAGSLAIEGGNPAGCTNPTGGTLSTDQRGVPRPQPPSGRCDIGAYERALPIVTTSNSAVTGNIVLFGVMVANPDPRAGTLVFDYGPTTGYGQQTATTAVPGNSTTPLTYILSASGLAPGTYHFQAVATNPDGSSTGTDGTFTIAAPSPPPPPPPPPPSPQHTAPSATTNSATAVGAYTANLNGVVDPKGSATTIRFQYGPGTSYSAQTAPQSIGAGTTSQTVHASIAALLPSHSYSVRLVASNAAGQTVSTGPKFSTAPRRPPPSLGVKVTPRTALNAPFKFRVKGRVVLPAGLGAGAGCHGTISLRALIGKANVGRAHTTVGNGCSYSLRVTLHGHHVGLHGNARLLVTFGGNAWLAHSSARPLQVAFG